MCSCSGRPEAAGSSHIDQMRSEGVLHKSEMYIPRHLGMEIVTRLTTGGRGLNVPGSPTTVQPCNVISALISLDGMDPGG